MDGSGTAADGVDAEAAEQQDRSSGAGPSRPGVAPARSLNHGSGAVPGPSPHVTTGMAVMVPYQPVVNLFIINCWLPAVRPSDAAPGYTERLRRRLELRLGVFLGAVHLRNAPRGNTPGCEVLLDAYMPAPGSSTGGNGSGTGGGGAMYGSFPGRRRAAFAAAEPRWGGGGAAAGPGPMLGDDATAAGFGGVLRGGALQSDPWRRPRGPAGGAGPAAVAAAAGAAAAAGSALSGEALALTWVEVQWELLRRDRWGGAFWAAVGRQVAALTSEAVTAAAGRAPWRRAHGQGSGPSSGSGVVERPAASDAGRPHAQVQLQAHTQAAPRIVGVGPRVLLLPPGSACVGTGAGTSTGSGGDAASTSCSSSAPPLPFDSAAPPLPPHRHHHQDGANAHVAVRLALGGRGGPGLEAGTPAEARSGALAGWQVALRRPLGCVSAPAASLASASRPDRQPAAADDAGAAAGGGGGRGGASGGSSARGAAAGGEGRRGGAAVGGQREGRRAAPPVPASKRLDVGALCAELLRWGPGVVAGDPAEAAPGPSGPCERGNGAGTSTTPASGGGAGGDAGCGGGGGASGTCSGGPELLLLDLRSTAWAGGGAGGGGGGEGVVGGSGGAGGGAAGAGGGGQGPGAAAQQRPVPLVAMDDSEIVRELQAAIATPYDTISPAVDELLLDLGLFVQALAALRPPASHALSLVAGRPGLSATSAGTLASRLPPCSRCGAGSSAPGGRPMDFRGSLVAVLVAWLTWLFAAIVGLWRPRLRRCGPSRAPGAQTCGTPGSAAVLTGRHATGSRAVAEQSGGIALDGPGDESGQSGSAVQPGPAGSDACPLCAWRAVEAVQRRLLPLQVLLSLGTGLLRYTVALRLYRTASYVASGVDELQRIAVLQGLMARLAGGADSGGDGDAGNGEGSSEQDQARGHGIRTDAVSSASEGDESEQETGEGRRGTGGFLRLWPSRAAAGAASASAGSRGGGAASTTAAGAGAGGWASRLWRRATRPWSNPALRTQRDFARDWALFWDVMLGCVCVVSSWLVEWVEDAFRGAAGLGRTVVHLLARPLGPLLASLGLGLPEARLGPAGPQVTGSSADAGAEAAGSWGDAASAGAQARGGIGAQERSALAQFLIGALPVMGFLWIWYVCYLRDRRESEGRQRPTTARSRYAAAASSSPSSGRGRGTALRRRVERWLGRDAYGLIEDCVVWAVMLHVGYVTLPYAASHAARVLVPPSLAARLRPLLAPLGPAWRALGLLLSWGHGPVTGAGGSDAGADGSEGAGGREARSGAAGTMGSGAEAEQALWEWVDWLVMGACGGYVLYRMLVPRWEVRRAAPARGGGARDRRGLGGLAVARRAGALGPAAAAP
ncbi:hypothetical protein HYH03_016494 [Edaphochlamys debaryana]|uniref:Uncharacterized protein n=1 Tax=Edaphochlamys debaryana TaxID=47281 RepID=A0A835XKB3_9CHLO|nr:hypothetical protein HYH03_016494 [Edaphochlamys debaryana]|eukprot:KAG2484747.1 hypothetical protein HYH03_016494 [Edaphochlamys debaryana]